MLRYQVLISILFLALAACMTLACGSSSTQRTIQSITLSPASANAQDYAGGEVQFVATGHYASQPYTVTPLPQAQWGPPAGVPGSGVVVDSNGVAKCVASGTYSVGAWANLPAHDEVPCAIGQFGQPVCYTVVGTAKLTCP